MHSRVCLLWSMGAARDHSSGWRQDLSGLWRHGHAARLRWSEHHGAGRAKAEPLLGRNFLFSGRRGSLVKILYWDGQGFCLFAKRLEKGRFTWPSTKEGAVTLTLAQMSMLLEGLEWRNPQKTWAPTLAG